MVSSRGGQRFLTVGLPLIMLTVGGWLGIAHVLSGKFELKVLAMLHSHTCTPSMLMCCTLMVLPLGMSASNMPALTSQACIDRMHGSGTQS
jgi:hypothetical protein